MPLDKSDDMGDWIKDFYKSDAPQFKGKSKEKRRQMAIAAKLSAESLLGEADITISEKRAFILAARQAFVDGKKTFVFKEKEYKCTVKEDDDTYKEMADYLRAAKESTDQATGNPEDDGDAPSPDISDDELEKAADMSRQRMQKFGYEDSDVTGRALPESMKAKNIKAQTKVLQTLRKVGGKTKGHKMAMMDLLTMFDPKAVEKAYKANSRGFTNLMNMMYPRNKDSLTISDLTIDGKFMAKSGRFLSVDQTKQLGNPLDNVKESGDEDLPPHTDIQEMTQKFLFSSLPKAAKAEKAAGRHNLTVKGSGKIGKEFYVELGGNYTDIMKWLKRLDENIQESVEYHDRESMPSAVDDAADVMSSYTKFLKSTKTYY